MAPTARISKTILQSTLRAGLLLSGISRTSFFPSIKYQSFFVRVCSPPTLSLIFCIVSVSALWPRSMADTVCAGTLAVVEEFVFCPPAIRTSPTSTATEECPVVGLAMLQPVSFCLGKS